ncbi:MAG: phospholipase D-like domain-containing protein [Nitrospira sp.]|nr:phospholipase D-like domain-containing protein [Nitrospira sp.]
MNRLRSFFLFGFAWLAAVLGWFTVDVSAASALEVLAPSVEVWYAPEDRPLHRVVGAYEQATQYIYVAVYGVTFPPAIRALLVAHKRGVDVRVITDRQRMNDSKQRAAMTALREAGVPVKVNRHDGLMHLKQVVIDDRITISGSMNHTGSGNRYNDERLDIIRDRDLSIKARNKFLSMWRDQNRFEDWKPS